MSVLWVGEVWVKLGDKDKYIEARMSSGKW